MSSSYSSKRRDTEMTNLMMADFNVEPINDSMHKFLVDFHGPADTLYSGGMWKVKVELPDDFPYSSPSVNFVTKIYHPNVDFLTGAICVNVLNENWSAMSDLVTMFNIYLPLLLREPNPLDPLNCNAGALFTSDKPAYDAKVIEYRDKYANQGDDGGVPAEESGDEEPSEDGSYSEDEAAAAGPVDP